MATATPGFSEEVAGEIARYLRANPLACDSRDGIARWWLSSRPVTESTLVATLSWMEREGLIEALVAADQRVRYRRAASDAALDRLIQS